MNGNSELLNFIYQNSQMGIITIEKLIGVSNNEDFNRYLNSQLDEYKSINQDVKALLNNNGYDEKGINTLEKIKTYIMINVQTMVDKTASHIAEMLMIGSNMGVINAIKNLKRYDDANPEIKNLMERLLRFEENNIQELKQFL